MLNYFRHHPLRKGLWLVVLFGSILTQTQTLYACNLMDGEPQATCCCDEHMENGCSMGGGCHFPPGEKPTGCCDITVKVVTQDSGLGSTTEALLVTQLDAPQPPPAILTTTEVTLALSDKPAGAGIKYHPPPRSAGTRTYLVTQRFRV